MFGLESLDLLFLKILGLKLFVNAAETISDLDLAPGLLLNILLLALGVFVSVLHTQFGDKDLDVELIADLLAIKQ